MAGERFVPEIRVVRLEVRPGVSPHALPPVRVFVGTEPEQQRAERVLLWSIERVRDPAREYRIHLLRDLPGFQRRGWRTGFSNYRFAVPHFACGRGRALYNDVDQVYLADPAELFDSPMDGCGYLAIARNDTSVMLLDCARMASVWTLRAAQRESKARLLRRAARQTALFGALAPEWNARDGEYTAGKSKCLHYTTLATQPWRPFPERFVYAENPEAQVFRELEASADAAGFQVFSRARPSPAFAGWLARAAAGTAPDPDRIHCWDVGDTQLHHPAGPPQSGGAVATCGVLDTVPADDLPWLLDELADAAGRLVHVAVRCDGRSHPARALGVASRRPRTPEWWVDRIDAAAQRHPDLHWQLVLRTPDGRCEVREAGRHVRASPPRVWLLNDDRPGCTGQAQGLAAALGWPTERKRLVFNRWSLLHNRLLGASRLGILRARLSQLTPPWPDLVIAAGRRNAPVARWIRGCSGGATRVVLLGRKAADAADLCDLAVTPAHARLFPHPHRITTLLPLHPVSCDRLGVAAERWREAWEGLPRPRIGVLVGGRSGQYHFPPEVALRLGEDLARLARETGGSILATTSRRTGAAAAAALRDGLGGTGFLHTWSADGEENPYLGVLAAADAFVVTCDSESMLAEALSIGRSVAIYPLPTRRSFTALRLPRACISRWAEPRRPGRRGTTRPQKGLAYLAARLIDRGWVRPVRDLDLVHAELIARGLIRRFGDPFVADEQEPVNDLAAVAGRVRELMGL